jgi:hypothetical protein
MFEEVEEAPSLRNRWFAPQIELRSGSMQSGYVVSMDDTAIRFEAREGKSPVSLHSVAHVRFQPLPSRLAPILSAGRPGVLLNSGEFIEGECRGLVAGVVTSSSCHFMLETRRNDYLVPRAAPCQARWGRRKRARWLAPDQL